MVISFKDTDLERITGSRSDKRLSPSLVAKRDLERYYILLSEAESHLGHFTNNEMALIYDACNGTIFDAVSAEPGVRYNVQDAILLNKLDAKHDVDGQKLVDKLHALTPIQAWALVDKIERYWSITL